MSPLKNFIFAGLLGLASQGIVLSSPGGTRPKPLVWKWDSTIFENGNLERKTTDILGRSSFDVVLNLHFIDKSMHDPELKRAIAYAANAFKNAHRRFVVDFDVRGEQGFVKQFPKQRAAFTQFVEFNLDTSGSGSIELPALRVDRWINKATVAPTAIIRAWAFEKADKNHFKRGTLSEITPFATIEPLANGRSRICVNVASRLGGMHVLVCPFIPHVVPDFFSESFYPYWDEMFRQYRNIPLGGACIDEWGWSIPTHNDPGIGFNAAALPYSIGMNRAYLHRYGQSLDDDLIYLRFCEEGADSNRIRAANRYLSIFRTKNAENESWFYAETKKYFWKDAFVSTHPTWLGIDDCFMEILNNGLDWWEVKRDFSQTDESVSYPIRLALMHKWKSPVWYNMFYCGGYQYKPFFEQAWRYAGLGGRMDYCDYESRPEHNFSLLREGLTASERMEHRISKLDSFQRSVPDSRVLVVFGYDACVNWGLDPAFEGKWLYSYSKVGEPARFATNLLRAGYLCDLVPSTEIDNGSLKIRNGKAVYGSQMYDALIYVQPECMSRATMKFLKSYIQRNPHLILAGDCLFHSDGSSASAEFREIVSKVLIHTTETPPLHLVISNLQKWQVPANRFPHGCVLQDGSAILSAASFDGVHELKEIGNQFSCSFKLNGYSVWFEGEDFLGIDIDKDGKVKRVAAGKIGSLTIDGKKAPR